MPPCCGNPRMGVFLHLPGPLNQATAEELMAKLANVAGLHHIIKKASVFYAHLHFETLFDAAVFAHGNINRNVLASGLLWKRTKAHDRQVHVLRDVLNYASVGSADRILRFGPYLVVCDPAPPTARRPRGGSGHYNYPLHAGGRARQPVCHHNPAPGLNIDALATEVERRKTVRVSPRRKLRVTPKDICANAAIASPPL
ncbi:hypothetical protein BDZ88DRAFT_333208 [Geranomyces variabilis]|nr:hypothetical protein BDZ88DRAFT_333208 [Geranomyces variabilis]